MRVVNKIYGLKIENLAVTEEQTVQPWYILHTYAQAVLTIHVAYRFDPAFLEQITIKVTNL